MTFLYANRLKLCMRIDLMLAIRIVGETASMYANQPRSCWRNDVDVCESTCMRNDRHPSVQFGLEIIFKACANETLILQ